MATLAGRDGSPFRVIDIVALTTLAAFLRGRLLLSTIDTPGDGPAKAWLALNWANAPHVVLHGIWPPGFLYLTGLVSYVLPIWIGLRLFNALVGTATVPVFFTTVGRVFGPPTGLIAAAFIAVFPLHVELSASSLTEASAILEVALGVAFLTMAAQPGARRPAMLNGLAIGCLVLASMTRYEAWFLLPLFPGYYWLRTGHWRRALGMAALLFAFPVAWTIGNHVYEGNALLGLRSATHDPSFGHVGVPFTSAAKMLVMHFATHLGWVVVVFFALGLVMECRSLVAGRLSPERILYLAIVLVLLAGSGVFAMIRGATVTNRYLLFGFAFSLPMAALPISAGLQRMKRHGLWLVIVLLAMYTAGSSLWTGRMETAWVTRAKPESIIRFEEWVNKTPWRAGAMIFTRMDWQPTYLAYYFPAFAGRAIIISEWLDDTVLQRWTQAVQPALLVTQRGDEAYVQRFVRVTGIAVAPERLVYRNGDVRIYELPTPLSPG